MTTALATDALTEDTDSAGTVAWAFTVNATIAVAKTGVAVATGSAAMMAEALHSYADIATEVLLGIGVWHGRRRDRARYFWALCASIYMFAAGGMYAAWEGVSSILSPEAVKGAAWTALVVLAVSAALESTSCRKALGELAASRNGVPWLTYWRTTTNTTAKTVVAEDGADILGCVLAAAGVVLRLVTGSTAWEGLAAVLVAVVMLGVAYELGSQNLRLLTASE